MPNSQSTRDYLARQNFNAITSFLHGQRYPFTLDVIDRIVPRNGPVSILEIGCGTGHLLPELAKVREFRYTGFDINASYVADAENQFGNGENVSFFEADALTALTDLIKQGSAFDVVIALETFEHLGDHIVPRALDLVARLAPQKLVVSVPVEFGPSIFMKNTGSALMGYMRHREYTWAETFWATIDRLDRVPPHGGGHKGFDWRTVAREISQRFETESISSLPSSWIPKAFATNVFITANGKS